MESRPPSEYKFFLENAREVINVVNAMKLESIIGGKTLRDFESDVALLESFMTGTQKFSFLLQSDQNGKSGATTCLNTLLDDIMIPNSVRAPMVIVQYDENYLVPELFVTKLNKIFNEDKKIFIVKQEYLEATGKKGRLEIYNALKKSTQNKDLVNDSISEVIKEMEEPDLTVYIIKYKIEWMKQYIGDDFILERVQFIDFNMPRHDPSCINIFQRILVSPENGNLFVFDAHNLYKSNTAQVYKDIRGENQNSLLLINKTDTLGTEEHFNRIEKNKGSLCKNLGKTVEELEKEIEETEETEEVRCEIFRQSFYESQNMNTDDLEKREVVHFISGLFVLNKIIINQYETCLNEEERADLRILFEEINGGTEVFKTNQEMAEVEGYEDILQYYVDNLAYIYKTNFTLPVKKAIAEIIKSKFLKLREELYSKVGETKEKLTRYDFFIGGLTSKEREELEILRQKVNTLFLRRLERLTASLESFKNEFIEYLGKFQEGIADLHLWKATMKDLLIDKVNQLKKDWRTCQDIFLRDRKAIETAYTDELSRLDQELQSDILQKYLREYANRERIELKKETRCTWDLMYYLSIWLENMILDFIDCDKNNNSILWKVVGKGKTNILWKLSRLFLSFFVSKKSKTLTLESLVHSTSVTFKEISQIFIKQHSDEDSKRQKNFKADFAEYLKSAQGDGRKKAQLIIEKHFEKRLNYDITIDK